MQRLGMETTPPSPTDLAPARSGVSRVVAVAIAASMSYP
jgi:hypothetical protein